MIIQLLILIAYKFNYLNCSIVVGITASSAKPKSQEHTP